MEYRELFENIIAPRSQRLTSSEHAQLAELLVAKDEELKQTLVVGDQRRPYPTDIEMRQGYLGRLSDLPLSGPPLQQQGNLGDLSAARGHHDQNPLGQSFSWQIGGDIKPPMSSNHNSVGMDTKAKENEDVEVMSTDSSSKQTHTLIRPLYCRSN
ncbi:mediator of RNA polymerase II transcription subunit, putative [Ixodes scapularis]|uniref:Mediator of RNA polymerase II transcription subunit, putative n=1 Tax=Ixodes scapularis TaxID=6945 RepID=B7P3K9_IXOSC|nr:mediator of RNA polymerase II transcription subunit, putative [Ixodes scapularis]|eukprot:XP_002404342.1 mediator of RNA polymerase II transcription subunit, putative [Ixodes scapularis]